MLRRLLSGWLFAALVSAGCASDAQRSAEDPATPDDYGETLPTTVERHDPPAEEQAAAESMLADAMVDGVMTDEELELFVIEYVQCIGRAGFEATLRHFGPRTRTVEVIVRSAIQEADVEPGEDPSEWAESACDAAYLSPALNAHETTNSRSEEEIRQEQERREQRLLDCARDAGHEHETIDDFLADESVSHDVRRTCVNAHND